MLVTSISLFSKNVNYHYQNKFQFLATVFLSSKSALNLDECKILSFGKELRLTSLTDRLYGV